MYNIDKVDINLSSDFTRLAQIEQVFLNINNLDVRRPAAFDIFASRADGAQGVGAMKYNRSVLSLTVAEIPGVISTNPAVYFVFDTNNRYAIPFTYMFLPPDSSLVNFLSYASANNDVTLLVGINSFRALPLRYFPPISTVIFDDDVALATNAGADNNLRTGLGSFNWKILTIPRNAADTVTNILPALPSFRNFGGEVATDLDH
jgi:hypothetical protein